MDQMLGSKSKTGTAVESIALQPKTMLKKVLVSSKFLCVKHKGLAQVGGEQE